jgi:predicted metalloprotease
MNIRNTRLFVVPVVVSVLSVTAQAARVTAGDVRDTVNKVNAAQRIFERSWAQIFNGADYVGPRLVAYVNPIRTPCGAMYTDNAGYCPMSNTIYYDPVFLAHLTRTASDELGSDGDYAAVVALAHEWGHAVALQLGIEHRLPVLNEAVADCLAGAVTRQLDQDGYLDPGDLDEARFTFSILGDHPGVRMSDSRAHGDSQTRVTQFTRGFNEGLSACTRRMGIARAYPRPYWSGRE